MRLVLISPEGDDPREHAALAELCGLGLERYHVRKPGYTVAQLEAWLHRVVPSARPCLVLHQHHELAEKYGLLGIHHGDAGVSPARGPASNRRCFFSRSTHDLTTLIASLGHYDAVFFSPVFPSISKAGYGPRSRGLLDDVSRILRARAAQRTAPNEEPRRPRRTDGAATSDRFHEAVAAASPHSSDGAATSPSRHEPRPSASEPFFPRTEVIALGGITPARVQEVAALGFDGGAILGAVWQSDDPVAAFQACRQAALDCAEPADSHGGLPSSALSESGIRNPESTRPPCL